MSDLAIAFPSEVAAQVAEKVLAYVAELAWPLLLLSLMLIMVLVCKPYAIRLAERSRSSLAQLMARR